MDDSSSDSSNASAEDQTSEELPDASFTSVRPASRDNLDDIGSHVDGQTTAAGDALECSTRRLTADGLSDAGEVRLRRMETGNGLKVDVLKLHKLWSHLHVNGKLVSDVYYIY